MYVEIVSEISVDIVIILMYIVTSNYVQYIIDCLFNLRN